MKNDNFTNLFSGGHLSPACLTKTHLPCNTITCCCSRKIALWRYPPKAVFALFCELVCVCLRFLERCPSAGRSTLLSTTFLSALSFVGPLAFFSWTESFFVICGIIRSCSFCWQLHRVDGEEKTWICSRQTIETQTAITLIPKENTPWSPPLSLAELVILSSISARFALTEAHDTQPTQNCADDSQIFFLTNKDTFYKSVLKSNALQGSWKPQCRDNKNVLLINRKMSSQNIRSFTQMKISSSQPLRVVFTILLVGFTRI